MFPPFLGYNGAQNADYAANQVSASPPPSSKNDSVCSPSYSSTAERRYLNFMLQVKSPSPSPSKSSKSELIG